MRATPSVVTDDLEGRKPLPVWAVEIDTGASPAVLRFTSREHAVTFGADAFSARPIEVGTITIESMGAGAFDLKVSDADAYFNSILTVGVELRGREARLYLTVEAATGAGSDKADSILSTMIVQRLSRAQGVVTISLKPRAALFDVDVPRGIVSRETYPGIIPAGAGV